MPQFKSFAPDARVSGRMVLAFTDCVDYRRIGPYLSQYGFMGRQGFEKINPKAWYYLQDWLSVMSDIYYREDESAALRDFITIGRGMVGTLNLLEKVAYYPLFETIQTIPYLYDDLHRGDAGNISVRRISREFFQVVSYIPYPDDLLFGLLAEAAERYDASRYPVQFNPDTPGRDEGGEVTIYDIGLY
jgi:hypothetical protein